MTSTAPSNFEDLLNMNAEDAVKPPARPGGTYRATLKSSEETVSSKKRTKGLTMTFSDLEPQADVDASAWDEYENSPMTDTKNETMSDDFWVTLRALYRITDLCKACGINTEGQTVLQMVGKAIGERVLLTVQQNISDNGAVYSNITGYAIDEE